MERPAGSGLRIEVLFHGAQAHRRELLQTVERLRQLLTSDCGMGACEVFEDNVIPNRFLWRECWPTEQAAEASLASDRFATLQAAIRHLGRIEAMWRVHLAHEIPFKPITDAVGSEFGLDTDRS